MNRSLLPSGEEFLVKMQDNLPSLIGFSNLEEVIQGIFSVLRRHDQQFAQAGFGQKEILSLESRIAELTNRVGELEGLLRSRDRDIAALSMTMEDQKKCAEATNQRIEKLEKEIHSLKALLEMREKEYHELRDSVRGYGDRIYRCEAKVESNAAEVHELRQQLQMMEKTMSKKIDSLDKSIERKLDEDRMMQEFIPRDRHRRELSDKIDMLFKSLEKFERGFGMEFQSIIRKLDDKLDKGALASIDALFANIRTTDTGTLAAGKVHYRCLCCNQVNQGFTDTSYIKIDGVNHTQSYANYVNSSIQQTKQYSMMGSDGRVYMVSLYPLPCFHQGNAD
eukprot:TRINITY_DN1432_c0_g1_i14.p1 TRINITY_DN1432_c0_g1~~TRINITY_DN1432_c0_g1_i14.p1  ORF type:complete len:336 (+),score=55.70 TRINITY_DN1432_c0_g1_i14:210-1217(+)